MVVGQRVIVPITYMKERMKNARATVIAMGTYKGGRRFVDVKVHGKFFSWRERFYEEDVKCKKN